jgi:hypothetical protein
MKKAGINTVGPTSFLQVKEKYENLNESELVNENGSESDNYYTKESNEAKVNSQIDAELASETQESESSENTNQKTEETTEKDEVSDDDVAEPMSSPKLKLTKKKIPYVFTEVSSKTITPPLPAVKQDKEILYNAPAKKYESQMMDKIKILRENSMRKLQKTHVWSPARSERKNEKFNKIKYAQGNKDADLFVSFLGYIRDTTYKQSPPLFDKIKERYVK